MGREQVLGSDLLYWGGWSLLDVDTRGSLLDTLLQACGDHTDLWLAFVVRDVDRERDFLEELWKHFTLGVYLPTRDLLSSRLPEGGLESDPLDRGYRGEEILKEGTGLPRELEKTGQPVVLRGRKKAFDQCRLSALSTFMNV